MYLLPIDSVFEFVLTGTALRMLLDVLALVDELVRAAAGEPALGWSAELLREARECARGSCG